MKTMKIKDHKKLAADLGHAAIVAERMRYAFMTVEERETLETMLRNAAMLAWHHARKWMEQEQLKAIRNSRRGK